MTLREAIDLVDKMKPNQYTTEDKVRWLSEVDYYVYHNILLTHKMPRCKKVSYSPYTVEDLDKQLLVPFPFDSLYSAYIKMKIDEENQETQRYNVSAEMYNYYYNEYAKHINSTRMHIGRNAYHIY